jgi:hypothetical protein
MTITNKSIGGIVDALNGVTSDVYATEAEAKALSESAKIISPATLRKVLESTGPMSAYGVRWDTSQASPVMTKGIVIAGVFVPFDYQDFPIQQKMRRCVVDNTKAVQYYLHPADSSLKDDGITASNLDGTDGQVCVEVEEFEHLICKEGNYAYFLVGNHPFYLTGAATTYYSTLHPWFMEGGARSQYKYIGAFEGVLKRSGSYVDGTGAQTGTAGDLIHSVYGYIPLTYFTRTERRTYTEDGVFHQWGIFAEEAIILLYLTEYATWYSQDATTGIPGYTEGTPWAFSKVCKTGITVGLGNNSGSVTYAEDQAANALCPYDWSATPTIVVANSFRGIENFFGHIWKWVDGVNINYVGSPLTDAEVYVCNNPDDWADDTTTDYVHVEDQDGTPIDLPLTSGYQSALHKGLLWPSAVAGGSDTYITDYFYASLTAGWRALRSGGDLDYGATAGCACRDAYSTASSRSESIGGRSAA